MRTTGWMMLAALMTAGCGNLTGGYEPEPNAAVLAFHGDPVEVIVPETATAGVPFTVAIRTYGGGCVRKGTTDVRVEGSNAHLYPHDIRTEPSQAVCTAELRLFRHEASVRIEQPGRATVRVYGVRVSRGDESEPLVVTRTLDVRRATEPQ